MIKRLASMGLVLVIVGGAFGGIPLHSNEQECSVPAMADMDCCKKALQLKFET